MTARHAHLGATLLGKYRVQQVIGEGGMGVVYAARDLRLDRVVAIKVLDAPSEGFGDVARRFRREAQAIGKLHHPNLVTLLEYDVLDDGTPAMVMELIEGRSLRDLLVERRFTADETVSLLRQTLEALQVCHTAGVVHRDLKPENLLLEERGDRLFVRLIDFGLTKLTADEGATALTVNGEVFGSPRFMAPEQWFRNAVDGRTDLYALALIGYWLVLGDHFIKPGNPVDICRAHLQQARPPLLHNALGEPVPPGLAAALVQAAHPEPGQRPVDAAAMRAVLLGEATPGAAIAGDLLETAIETAAFALAALKKPSESTLSFHPQAIATDLGQATFETEDDATTIEESEAEASSAPPAGLPDPEAPTVVDEGALHAQLEAALAGPVEATAPIAERASEEIRQFRGSEVQRALQDHEENRPAPARSAARTRPTPRPLPTPAARAAAPDADDGDARDVRILAFVALTAVVLGAVAAFVFLR